MIRKLWTFLFAVALVVATFGWLYLLAWLAWEAVSPIFAQAVDVLHMKWTLGAACLTAGSASSSRTSNATEPSARE